VAAAGYLPLDRPLLHTRTRPWLVPTVPYHGLPFPPFPVGPLAPPVPKAPTTSFSIPLHSLHTQGKKPESASQTQAPLPALVFFLTDPSRLLAGPVVVATRSLLPYQPVCHHVAILLSIVPHFTKPVQSKSVHRRRCLCILTGDQPSKNVFDRFTFSQSPQ